MINLQRAKSSLLCLVLCLVLGLSLLLGAFRLPGHAATHSAAPDQWGRIGATGGASVQALAVDASQRERLYAGTDLEGLFVTTDGGSSWSNPLAAAVAALAIDPSNPCTIYAGSWHHGAFKSTDRGQSWSPINTGLAADTVYALVVVPGPRMTLYAGTEMGVFASIDGGGQWLGASNGFTGQRAYALGLLGDALLTGTDMGVFTKSAGEAGWTSANSGLTANVVNCLAVDGDTVYSGTDRGVFVSDDGGASWRGAGQSALSQEVYALATAPGAPPLILAGTATGVYGSANRGDSWVPLSAGLSGYALQVNALAVWAATEGWTALAGTSDGVYQRALRAEDMTLRLFLPTILAP